MPSLLGSAVLVGVLAESAPPLCSFTEEGAQCESANKLAVPNRASVGDLARSVVRARWEELLPSWLGLRRERIVPQKIDDALDLLKSGKHEAAHEAAEQLNAPAGRILVAGLRRRGRSIRDVERAMEDQGGKEVEKMRSNIRPMFLIASIAPLLGLLGTVIGIQDAFAVIVTAGMGKPEYLAGGIEEALVTTITGLCVAIPALLIASHFSTKVRRLMIETDEKLTPAVDHLVPHAT